MQKFCEWYLKSNKQIKIVARWINIIFYLESELSFFAYIIKKTMPFALLNNRHWKSFDYYILYGGVHVLRLSWSMNSVVQIPIRTSSIAGSGPEFNATLTIFLLCHEWSFYLCTLSKWRELPTKHKGVIYDILIVWQIFWNMK